MIRECKRFFAAIRIYGQRLVGRGMPFKKAMTKGMITGLELNRLMLEIRKTLPAARQITAPRVFVFVRFASFYSDVRC
jgi:hypothetical protein